MEKSNGGNATRDVKTGGDRTVVITNSGNTKHGIFPAYRTQRRGLAQTAAKPGDLVRITLNEKMKSLGASKNSDLGSNNHHPRGGFSNEQRSLGLSKKVDLGCKNHHWDECFNGLKSWKTSEKNMKTLFRHTEVASKDTIHGAHLV